MVAFVGLLVFVMPLRATEWPAEGGGIIIRPAFGWSAWYAFYFDFGLVTTILFSMRSTINALLAGTFLTPFFISPFFMGKPTAQRYLEPALAVALFLFGDTQTGRKVFNKRVLICNFVFSTLVLAISIGYYSNFSLEVCSSVARTSG